MAVNINAEVRVTGTGSITDALAALSQGANLGGSILPQLRTRYTYGTGDGQVNKWYLAKRTLPATTYDDLNLTSGLTALGTTQAFTKLKLVLVAVVSPDGAKKLRVGPQGRTNAAQLWFQATSANFWEECFTYVLKERPVTGWTATAGSADVFSVYNPGATALDYAIWLLGN